MARTKDEDMSTTAITDLPTATLTYTNGTSDKEYRAWIEASGAGFVVNFAYGRRGGSLTTGAKTAAPVEFAAAVVVFEKLVKGKQAKGYTTAEDGTPYQHSVVDRQVSGLLPQLLNVADEADAARMVSDPAWCLQEKMDGRRLMLRKSGDSVEAINKLGLVVGVCQPVVQAALELSGDFIIDGEIVGERFHAFDVISVGGNELGAKAYRARYAALAALVADGGPSIIAVGVWSTAADKAEQLAALKARGAEGVVFKLWDSTYKAGRPNSGGPQLKFKFVATLSAVVTAVNAQRSVGVSLLGDDGWVSVGNVTIPANHDVPAVGAVVEVRYLYAAPMLCQPVYLGVRCDVEAPECVTAQLKFKTV